MVEEYSFTPIKSAQKSMADAEGFWLSPPPMNLEQKDASDMLTYIGVKKESALKHLKQLVNAAREVAVKLEEGKTAEVPTGLGFLLQEPQDREQAYSQLVQLLGAVRVSDQDTMGFAKKGGRGMERKCWFMRALASRAVGLAVIAHTGA